MILENKAHRERLLNLILPSLSSMSYFVFFFSIVLFGKNMLGFFFGSIFTVAFITFMLGIEKKYIVLSDKFIIRRRWSSWFNKKPTHLFEIAICDIRRIEIIENKGNFTYTGHISTFIIPKAKKRTRIKFNIDADSGYESLLLYIAFLEKKNIHYHISTNIKKVQKVLDENGIKYRNKT